MWGPERHFLWCWLVCWVPLPRPLAWTQGVPALKPPSPWVPVPWPQPQLCIWRFSLPAGASASGIHLAPSSGQSGKAPLSFGKALNQERGPQTSRCPDPAVSTCRPLGDGQCSEGGQVLTRTAGCALLLNAYPPVGDPDTVCAPADVRVSPCPTTWQGPERAPKAAGPALPEPGPPLASSLSNRSRPKATAHSRPEETEGQAGLAVLGFPGSAQSVLPSSILECGQLLPSRLAPLPF